MRSIRTGTLVGISVFTPLAGLAGTAGSVRGYVRCAACSTPTLGDATVTLRGPSGMWTTVSDAHGFYVIFGVIPEKYEISALKPAPAQRSTWPHPWPWYDLRYVCIHAGEDITLSLNMRREGSHGFFYAPWVKRNLEEQLRQPDASQTADVYNVGDC